MLLAKGKVTATGDGDPDQHPDQPVTQLDQVGDEGLFGARVIGLNGAGPWGVSGLARAAPDRSPRLIREQQPSDRVAKGPSRV